MENSQVVDTRMELSFNSAHIPAALSLWLNGLPTFAGWFLSYDSPILLVNEEDDPTEAMRYLIRLGFDEVEGFLSGDMPSWHKSEGDSEKIDVITVDEICSLLDKGKEAWILDVRSDEEVERAEISDAKQIHLPQLKDRMNEVPKEKEVYIFCGSGLRSTTAASVLKRNGWENIHVVLGGTSGWNSTTCPIEK